ncbi:MAG: hotdog fold domain-containing protein [Polyangiales bacterium]
MAVSTFFKAGALSADPRMNFIRDVWNRLERFPGGKRLYSRLVGQMAPYTSSISAAVEELGEGYSRVTLSDRRAVRNHLSCIHAVALANLVELTGNLALGYSLPNDARFIVAGMSLDYLKKARGTITGECRTPPIDSSARQEHEVKVTLRDEGGEVVVEGTLRTLVGPKVA